MDEKWKKEIEEWLDQKFVHNDMHLNNYLTLNESLFEDKFLLYETQITIPLLVNIIDGISKPSAWKFDTIINSLLKVDGVMPYGWFLIQWHDDAWIECKVKSEFYPNRHTPLWYFEEDKAEQSGAMLVGLIDKDRSWILAFRLFPENHWFKIEFFGTRELCLKYKNIISITS